MRISKGAAFMCRKCRFDRCIAIRLRRKPEDADFDDVETCDDEDEQQPSTSRADVFTLGPDHSRLPRGSLLQRFALEYRLDLTSFGLCYLYRLYVTMTLGITPLNAAVIAIEVM